MLLDYCQSSARAGTVTLNSVRIIQIEITPKWNLRRHALLFQDVAIIRRRAELFRAPFSLANTLQEVCSRSETRRHECVKGDRVSQYDWSDYQHCCDQHAGGQASALSPTRARQQKYRQRPKENQQHRVGSQPARSADKRAGSQRPTNP